MMSLIRMGVLALGVWFVGALVYILLVVVLHVAACQILNPELLQSDTCGNGLLSQHLSRLFRQ